MAVVAVRQSVVWPDQFGDDSRGRFWCASLVGVRLVCWCAGLLLLLVFGCWCNRLLLMVNSCWNGGAGLLKSSVDAGCLDICIYHLYFTPISRRNVVQQCTICKCCQWWAMMAKTLLICWFPKSCSPNERLAFYLLSWCWWGGFHPSNQLQLEHNEAVILHGVYSRRLALL